ncbi:unnamed protein product [Clonostachys chloroleuca]|uniref:Uncharacterized protein n=1 Tax=Clonostachys chloroleuca TaxID=1926264 RepID=A0AA35Q670_9HYPO|nr:unnamed protein product [Clonostachys chloroleuca]
MRPLLKGSAFITGAASGIGQHTAAAFARHGVTRLAIADIHKDNLAATRKAFQKQFPKIEILPIHLDVRSSAQVQSAIAETVRAFGRLDVAVNNAGIGGSGRLTHEIEEEEIMRILDVNLNGVYRCQKEELAVMVKQEDLGPREGRGRIINVASMYGIVAPYHGMAHTAYTTAKHAVVGLTRGDANAYAGFGIRINAIAPGFVETPLVQATMEQSEDKPLAREVRRSALGRIGRMEEIGDAIVWLASPMNSYMQGAVQVVDGGLTSA